MRASCVPSSSMLRRRLNGLQRPFARQQVLAWLAIAVCFIEFWTLLFPFLPASLALPAAVAYGVVFGLGFVVFVLVSVKDPQLDRAHIADDVLITRHCYTCPGVMPEQTKHCRICNKCVERFDHHCLYLNTCIGKQNYRTYFLLVLIVTILIAGQLTAFLYIFFRSSSDVEIIRAIHDSIFESRSLYLSIVSVLSLIPLGTFLCVAVLLIFHIYIIALGTTTYDWILGKQDVKAEIEMQKLQSVHRQENLRARRQDIYDEWLKERNLMNMRAEAAASEESPSPPTSPSGAAAADVAAAAADILAGPELYRESPHSRLEYSTAESVELSRCSYTDVNATAKRRISLGAETEHVMMDVLGIADVELTTDGSSGLDKLDGPSKVIGEESKDSVKVDLNPAELDVEAVDSQL